MLNITYFGHTSFALEAKGTTILLNPGIWDGNPVVPDDFEARMVIATNHADDALGNSATISVNSKAWFLGSKDAADKAAEQGVKPWLLHVLE
ncbi:MAG: MBL fold metallo-hydrolase, partial [Candidatus Thorarchaeota archaeon]